MGTVVTLELFGLSGDVGVVSEILTRAAAVLCDADDVFSLWRPESPMSRLRRGEMRLHEAPPEVGEVLELCAMVRDRSGGFFDPWAMPGGVDPTGLVKGWAAQRALSVLTSSGASGACVNAAGDVAVSGEPAPGVSFRIGVLDPFDAQRLCCVVEPLGSVATSGDYERGAHLIDPSRGVPFSAAASASVTGPDLAVADGLATALAVGGRDVLDLLRDDPLYAGLLIDRDGFAEWTPGFAVVSESFR